MIFYLYSHRPFTIPRAKTIVTQYHQLRNQGSTRLSRHHGPKPYAQLPRTNRHGPKVRFHMYALLLKPTCVYTLIFLNEPAYISFLSCCTKICPLNKLPSLVPTSEWVAIKENTCIIMPTYRSCHPFHTWSFEACPSMPTSSDHCYSDIDLSTFSTLKTMSPSHGDSRLCDLELPPEGFSLL